VLTLGFARRLIRSTAADDPRREELEIIMSEVGRLERLIDEVLGYSKLGKPERKPTEINKMIQNVMVTMQAELETNAVRLVFKLSPTAITAEVDESQLYQAVINLVSDSLDAKNTLTAATSSGLPNLFNGISCLIFSFKSSGSLTVISV
jgi:signal transduction histidine kinase